MHPLTHCVAGYSLQGDPIRLIISSHASCNVTTLLRHLLCLPFDNSFCHFVCLISYLALSFSPGVVLDAGPVLHLHRVERRLPVLGGDHADGDPGPGQRHRQRHGHTLHHRIPLYRSLGQLYFSTNLVLPSYCCTTITIEQRSLYIIIKGIVKCCGKLHALSHVESICSRFGGF